VANRICRTSEPFLYLSKPMKLFAILSEIRSWNLIFSKDRRITVIFIILVNGRTGCSFLPSSLIFSLIVSQSIRNIIYCKNSCPSLSTTFFGTALRGWGTKSGHMLQSKKASCKNFKLHERFIYITFDQFPIQFVSLSKSSDNSFMLSLETLLKKHVLHL